MSAGRRAGGRGHDSGGHDEPDERWAVSYADMVTVLMCLFIVLFAISNVDKGKFDQLANSLSTGFGQDATKHGADITKGLVIPQKLLADEGVPDLAARAAKEFASLEALRDRMKSALAAQGLDSSVDFTIDDRGLKVGLIGAETFFADNSTDLSPRADAVLSTVGGVLSGIGNQLSIEGHADHRLAAAPFATNWELSGGRATQVARFLVEAKGIAGARVSATGFADTRPLAQGDSAEALAKNRRVDIVIESTEQDPVRALLPALAAAAEREGTGTP